MADGLAAAWGRGLQGRPGGRNDKLKPFLGIAVILAALASISPVGAQRVLGSRSRCGGSAGLLCAQRCDLLGGTRRFSPMQGLSPWRSGKGVKCEEMKEKERKLTLKERLWGPVKKMFAKEEIVTAGLTLGIFMDILFYSFPLPLMPNHLSSINMPSEFAGKLVSSSAVASLVAGLLIVYFQSRNPNSDQQMGKERQLQLVSLSVVAYLASAIAILIKPIYIVLLWAKVIMGAFSQVLWVYALAITSSHIKTVFGLTATAWLMLGSSAGELVGPVFGSLFYDLGGYGIRPPYLISSALMGLTAVIIGASAISAKPQNTTAVSAIENANTQIDNTSSKSVFRDKYLMSRSFLGSLSGGVVRGSIDVILPVHLACHLGASTTMIGILFGTATVAYALGATAASKIRSIPTPLVGAALGAVAGTILLPAQSFWGIGVAFTTLYLLSGYLGVGNTMAIQSYSNSIGKASEAMGAAGLLWTAAFAVGGVIGNLAGDLYQRQILLLVVGAINIVYSLGLWNLISKPPNEKNEDDDRNGNGHSATLMPVSASSS